jgi:hypothetical protein
MRTLSRATRCFDDHLSVCPVFRRQWRFRRETGRIVRKKQALQPAHEPYRHIGTLPRSSGVAVAARVFPVLW